MKKILFLVGLFFFGVVFSSNAEDVIKTHAISISGSIKYPADFKHFEYVNPDAPQGGTFKRGMFGSFDSFNNFATKGMAIKAAAYMYSSLLVRSLDEVDTFYGLIAETIEYPKDYSWVIFNLRENAKFQDGKKITAEDVVYSFYAIKNASPMAKHTYSLIDKAEVIDKYRVKFTFKKGESSIELPVIAGQLSIIPKHYWEKRDINKSTLEIPVGSGPYKIDSYEPNKVVVFKKVKNYWAEDVPAVKGMYNFKYMRFEYFRDQTVAFEGFKAGHFDFNPEQNTMRWNRGYHGKYFDMGLIKKEEMHNSNPQGMQGIFFNTSVYPLNIREVRMALNYAFDYEWVNKNMYFGQNIRYNSYFANSRAEGNGVPTADVKKAILDVMPNASKEILEKEFKFPVTTSDNNRDNLKKAVQLFEKAGFKLKNGKMVDKNGKQVVLNLLLRQRFMEQNLNPYRQALSRIGVSFNIDMPDQSSYMERMRTKEYQMIFVRIKQKELIASEQRSFFSSEAATEDGSQNYSLLKDEAVDKLLDKMATATYSKDLITYTKALDKVLLDKWLVIPLGYSPKFRYAYWDKLHHPEVTPTYNLFLLSIPSWWIDVKREKEINKIIKR